MSDSGDHSSGDSSRRLPQRERRRSYLLRWPVTCLVALQVVVYLALLASRTPRWPVLAWTVPVTLVAAGLALWRRGEPLGLLVWRRMAFRLGRRRRARQMAEQNWPGLLPALFPGLQVRGGRTRFGQSFGVATWADVAVSAVEIRQPSAGPLNPTVPVRLPVERILTRIRTAQIPVQSLAFITTATGGDPTGRPSALREVLQALGDDAATVASVRTVVAVRLDPYRARDAIAARGGGQVGLVATLATLTSLVETELRAEGLAAAAVEPRALVEHLRAGLCEPEESGPLVQHWDHVRSGATLHRGLVLSAWRRAAGTSLASAVVRPGPGTVVSVELFPGASGGLRTRAWVRHSRADAASLAAAGADLVTGIRPGLDLLPADGQQLRALRATTVLGGDHGSGI